MDLDMLQHSNHMPERTVSELSTDIKAMIEDGFAYVRVRGEVGRIGRPASGHLYFDLKEGGSILSAVCWRSQVPRLQDVPEEGLEMTITGRLTTYPGQSRYQVVVEEIEVAGRGALMLALEKLRKKLEQEGLFDPAHKRPLPQLPNIVGVVTSLSGAVLRDIIHRMRDRFPCTILVWPSVVQGEDAAACLTHAVDGFSQMASEQHILTPDVVIVARGGGSFEDLFCFHDEQLLRAVARCPIPVVSAVGHETDVTLIDFVADVRAPTPTAAAEMVLPRRDQMLESLSVGATRMERALVQRFQRCEQRFDFAERGLRNAQRRWAHLQERLQHLSQRLQRAPCELLRRKSERYHRLLKGLEPGALVRHCVRLDLEVKRLQQSMDRAIDRIQKGKQERLSHVSRMLEMVSHHSILQRGFLLAQNKQGDVVTLEELTDEQSIMLKSSTGSRAAIIDGAFEPRSPEGSYD